MSMPRKTQAGRNLANKNDESGLTEIRLSVLAPASDAERISRALEAIISVLPPLDLKKLKGMKGKLPNALKTRFRNKRFEITVTRPDTGSGLNAEADEPLSIEEAFPDSYPGSLLRGLRTREGITQKQMAEALNIPLRHVSEMESGKRPISLEMAKHIDATFNISYKIFL